MSRSPSDKAFAACCKTPWNKVSCPTRRCKCVGRAVGPRFSSDFGHSGRFIVDFASLVSFRQGSVGSAASTQLLFVEEATSSLNHQR